MEIEKSYYTRFSEYVIVSPQWKRRWARLISGVFSPLSIAIAAMALACYSLNDDSALTWMALYLILSILPPTLYIMYLVRKGIVSDFHARSSNPELDQHLEDHPGALPSSFPRFPPTAVPLLESSLRLEIRV